MIENAVKTAVLKADSDTKGKIAAFAEVKKMMKAAEDMADVKYEKAKMKRDQQNVEEEKKAFKSELSVEEKVQ